MCVCGVSIQGADKIIPYRTNRMYVPHHNYIYFFVYNKHHILDFEFIKKTAHPLLPASFPPSSSILLEINSVDSPCKVLR